MLWVYTIYTPNLYTSIKYIHLDQLIYLCIQFAPHRTLEALVDWANLQLCLLTVICHSSGSTLLLIDLQMRLPYSSLVLLQACHA
jgi:hypothetical protein